MQSEYVEDFRQPCGECRDNRADQHDPWIPVELARFGPELRRLVQCLIDARQLLAEIKAIAIINRKVTHREAPMPKLLDAAVKRIRARGVPESNAYAMATSALQKSGSLKRGSDQLTKQGRARQAMTPAQRRAHPPK